MDKINTDTLFPSNKKNELLSVDSLFAPLNELKTSTNTKMSKISLSIDPLIQTQDDIDAKIKQTYRDVYSNCFEKIVQSNSLKNLDLIFEIPKILNNNLIYDYDECSEYIINKLRQNYIDVCRISYNKLFITWINIRNNKKNWSNKKNKK
jgi:hypothetical protein